MTQETKCELCGRNMRPPIFGILIKGKMKLICSTCEGERSWSDVHGADAKFTETET